MSFFVKILLVIGYWLLVMPQGVWAGKTSDWLTNAALTAGINTKLDDPVKVWALVIQIALGFAGVIAFGFILYGGVLWMTAGGEAEKVTKAKDTIVNAAIGLVLLLGSYAVLTFVVGRLVAVLKP